MLKVGLTGSIAVGKSYVCDCLRELGAAVLDADLTAREVVAPGSKGLMEIAKRFGDEFILSNGELDRAKMGALVFADESKRLLLNSIIHPLVFAAQTEWLVAREAENPSGIAVIDAALMIESGNYKRFDKLVVVWCRPEIQLQRLMDRNGLGEAEALKRIAAQMPQDEKRRFADFEIDTSDGFEPTKRRTAEVFAELAVYNE